MHLSKVSRGFRLPRFPPSARALQATPRCRRVSVPRPLALQTGGAARPGPHPVPHDAGSAGCAGRTSRGRRSTSSSAAGPGTSVSGTRPGCSTRSGATPSMRVALFIAKQHKHGRSWGFAQVLPVPGQPRPGLPQWHRRRPQAEQALAGSGRTPQVKDVGEPGAGEPHARFDGGRLETEPTGSPRRRLPNHDLAGPSSGCAGTVSGSATTSSPERAAGRSLPRTRLATRWSRSSRSCPKPGSARAGGGEARRHLAQALAYTSRISRVSGVTPGSGGSG